MAEYEVLPGRTLVSAGIRTERGYRFQDPARVVRSIGETVARLSEQWDGGNCDDPDVRQRLNTARLESAFLRGDRGEIEMVLSFEGEVDNLIEEVVSLYREGLSPFDPRSPHYFRMCVE